MKRRLSYLIHSLLAVACLTVMLLATWDRPETTAVGGCLLGGAFILIGVIGFLRKWGSVSLLDWVVYTFIGYMLWRANSSEVSMYARSDTFLLLVASGVWSLRAYFQNHQEEWKKLWIVVMLASLVANTIGCIYQLNVDPTWGVLIQRSESASRYVSGVFSHYNYMASFCMVSAMSALGGAFASNSNLKWRVTAGFVSCGNLALLAMTHSRGAFVGTLVGGVVFAVVALIIFQAGISKSKRSSKILAISLSLSVLLGGVLWLSYLGNSRGWLTHGNEVMDNGRTGMSALAVDQFLQSPVYGDGAHSFEWRSIELWPDDLWQGAGTLDYVHQEYLQILAEYGSIGLGLLLLSLLGLILEYLYSLILSKRSVGDCAWRLAALAAVLAFATQGLFSFVAHIPALVLTVLMVTVLGRSVARKPTGLWVACVQNTLLITCGVVLTWMSFKELPAFILYTKSNETITVDYSDQPSEIDEGITALAELVKTAPNHQRYERLGLLAAEAYQMEVSNVNKERYLDQSVSAFEKAVELYPRSPIHRVNYARVLAWSGRGREAEEHYEYVVTNAARREYWTKAHWYYAEYCFEQGSALWLNRRTDEAYYYFLKSQKLLTKAKKNRLAKDMSILLEKRIQLLEDAGFEPKPPSEL